eukprot:TRINITY_DN2909_c0_g2_i8.p1 TRINITY_DN2909_c0_g2~~TRINITY_DN2909_c0_g2_i8.p1  ORF type:complete len:512 (-),score=89.47 TRINITY_DN2909_c0_g2_i8:2670-4205(-)
MSEQICDTLIIGGGMAAATTAWRLSTLLTATSRGGSRSSTTSRVVLVEARDRLGGRVWTNRGALQCGAAMDCGASWLHTPREEYGPNPLHAVAGELGIELSEDDGVAGDVAHIFDAGEPHTLPDEAEERFVPPELVVHAFQWLETLALHAETHAKQGESVASVVQPLVDGWLAQLAKQATETTEADHIPLPSQPQCPDGWTHERMMRTFRRLIQWVLRIAEQIDGQRLNIVGAQHWDAAAYLSDEDRLVPDGYGQFVDRMIDRTKAALGKEFEIHLSTEVTHVIVDPQAPAEHRVCVKTASGKTFRAQRVIVTVPLGVLKANVITFEPALPKAKTDAISRLGYGLLDKVFIEFPHRFWPEDMRLFGNLVDEEIVFPYTMSYEPLCGKPILLFFISCDFAEKVEVSSEKETIQNILIILRNAFGKEKVPDPVSHFITKWRQDPYSRGSYTHITADSSPDDCHEISQPIGREIFFAGESACKEGYGTVHGAYLSGVQVVEQVIKSMEHPPAKM